MLSILLLASFVYCGSGEPLWICAHAFTPNHECVYAICSNCKYKIEGNEKTKRRKRNDVDSTITTIDCNDPHSQNHKVHNLKDFCDDQYLTDTNLSTMVNKGKKVPQRCFECKRTIWNKKKH